MSGKRLALIRNIDFLYSRVSVKYKFKAGYSVFGTKGIGSFAGIKKRIALV